MLAAVVVSAGALVTAGALAMPAGAVTAHPVHHTLAVRQIAFGKRLHHTYESGGVLHREALTGPDDLGELWNHIFVGFQNGVGSQGEPSTVGNTDSTIVEFTLSGAEAHQWDVRGKVDGLSADPAIGKIIATVNEDSNSSLYTISPWAGVKHYTYNKPLPHKGGTDAISIFHGRIYISASAPGTSGTAAPSAPAVYAVTLHPATHVASVTSLYSITATAKLANGPHAGKLVRLKLTDPDSSEVVPSVSPRFAGSFMLDSQGDQELIFDYPANWHLHLRDLLLPTSIDDSAWATRQFGAIYTTDSSADTLDVVFGPFKVGTMYTAVTPCNENSAPATCPAPGFPANYLGTINLKTGAISKVATGDAKLNPKGMIYVP
jgi:hypothetical protein